MEIRATTKADIAAVDALLARSYPALLKADYPASVLVTALPIISRAQPGLVSCGTYFGLFEQGALRAAGGWTPERRRGLGRIRHVVTDADHIRKGFGRALMLHILRDASGAGIREMLCEATITAVPFYAACGFERLRDMRVALRPGISFPAVAMRMEL